MELIILSMSDFEVEVTAWSPEDPKSKQRMRLSLPFTLKYEASDQCYRISNGKEGLTIDSDLCLHLYGALQAEAAYCLGSLGKFREMKVENDDEIAIGRSRIKILGIYDGKRATLRSRRSSNASDLCRVCGEGDSEQDPLLSLCRCKGGTKCIHLSCIRQWNRSQEWLRQAEFRAGELKPKWLMCEICRTTYAGNSSVYLPELFADSYSTLPMALVRVTSIHAVPTHYLVNLNFLIVIGRSAAADIPIQDPQLSLQHCQLSYYEGRVGVRDLESESGTFLSCRSYLPLSSAACTTLRFKNRFLEIRPKRLSSPCY